MKLLFNGVCEVRGGTCRGQCSPPMWVPEIKLRASGLSAILTKSSCQPCAQLCTWVLGIRLRFSDLCKEHLTNSLPPQLLRLVDGSFSSYKTVSVFSGFLGELGS